MPPVPRGKKPDRLRPDEAGDLVSIEDGIIRAVPFDVRSGALQFKPAGTARRVFAAQKSLNLGQV
jgi:hypothetical protein